jgi:hypothetical protein
MSNSRVNLKKPWIAGLLAYLIPGAGHFYQRRYFKGTVFSVGILGSFFYGMYLGDWQPVYYRDVSPVAHENKSRRITLSFLAQVMIGVPSFPALVQFSRYNKAEDWQAGVGDRFAELDGRIESEFEGTYLHGGVTQNVVGRLEIKATRTEEDDQFIHSGMPAITGRFVGTNEKGEPIELVLGGQLDELGPRISGSSRCTLNCSVVDEADAFAFVGELNGHIPRSVLNWYQVPLTGKQLDDVHRRLGKLFEMAQVFTWIAGLLNILAIWDALEGPAYGYGDEKPSTDENSDSKKSTSNNTEDDQVPSSTADKETSQKQSQASATAAS